MLGAKNVHSRHPSPPPPPFPHHLPPPLPLTSQCPHLQLSVLLSLLALTPSLLQRMTLCKSV